MAFLLKLQRRMTRTSSVMAAFATILLVSCLAVFALAWQSLTRSRAHHLRLAETTAQNLCTVLADNLATSYEKIDLAVLGVKDEVERQLTSGHLDAAGLETHMRKLRGRVPALHALRVVNADGIVMHGDLPPGPPTSVADRAYFQRLKSDREAGLVFSKPLSGRVTAIWTVMLARRINRPDGSFGGIVYGAINLEKLGARFASVAIGRYGTIELRDPDLALIVGHGQQLTGPWRIHPQFNELRASGHMEGTYNGIAPADGVERIYAFTTLQSFGQYLSVGLGLPEVLEPWRREIRQLLGFVMAFLLLVGASAWMAISTWLRHQHDEEEIRSREALLAEANGRLLELNHQKDQFLGLVVHDLRNPLSGILLAAEVLEQESSLAQVSRIAKGMRHEGLEMQALMERFLDITRIDSGGIQAEPEPFDLVATIRHIVGRYQPQSRQKNLTFAFRGPETKVDAYADPRFVREVLDNLVSNAVKFSPAGTTVTLCIEEGSEEVVTSVEDQGPGLTTEDKARLFGRFVTLSAKPTAGEKSTGLGLNIVKHMVEAMSGRIWVDSEPGQGAAFRLALPKAKDAPERSS